MQLCLIIPLYNASKQLDQTFELLENFFLLRENVQILFVNDGSSDDSLEKLHQFKEDSELGIDILTYAKNKGKGYALKYALENMFLEYEYIAFTDVDLPYPLEKIIAAAHILEKEGSDIVIGDRSLESEKEQYSLYRKVFHSIFRIFLPVSIREFPDTQSGLKVFRSHIATDIFAGIKTHGWVFDVEILLQAVQKKYSVYRLPVTLREKNCDNGGVSFFRHGFSVLYDLVCIRWNNFQGKYNKKH